MLFNSFQGPGVTEEERTNLWGNFNNKRLRKSFIGEPTSVLEKNLRSPSSPNSSSTLSSSLGSAAGGGAASSDSGAGVTELHPVPPCIDVGSEKCEVQLEDWEAMLSCNGNENNFLHWISNDSNGVNANDDVNGLNFGLVDSLGVDPLSLMAFSEPVDEKPLLFNPNNAVLNPNQHVFMNQNPSFFVPVNQFNVPFEAHHSHFIDSTNIATGNVNSGNNSSLFLRRNQIQNVGSVKSKDEIASQHQALVDQLFKAAEFIEAGNIIGARGILARLNQFFPSYPIVGKPLLRSAFHFKEALLRLTNNSPPISHLSTPLDVILKLGTYKAFSEISPIVQFINFTSIQAILEEVNGYDNIHIVDFDVGVGCHWSSFMQELANRRGGAIPSLKITAFASTSSHHPLELHLTRENLSHFANDLNIPFEFDVLSLDSFDPSALLTMSANNEVIAVNFPIGSWLNHQSVASILRLVKQLNPKIVVSVEHGCDRSDLPFSHHFLHAFQSCTILLDSIDASGANQDVANKIERYLVQPTVENVILGRRRAMEKMMSWRSLFASAGFAPLQFSNFTETQAECLLKRVQVRGYQVEKRQASLFLCWHRGELVSISAWK